MNYITVLVVCCALIAYSLLSSRLEKSPLTSPMFFVLVGAMLHAVSFDKDLHISNDFIHILAEATLLIILFTDGVQINLKQACARNSISLRLLGLALPLSIGFGYVVGAYL